MNNVGIVKSNLSNLQLGFQLPKCSAAPPVTPMLSRPFEFQKLDLSSESKNQSLLIPEGDLQNSRKLEKLQPEGNCEEAKCDTTVSQYSEQEPAAPVQPDSKSPGFYTLKERQEKIKRYKEKIQKWIRGENNNKDRYILRSKIAKQKPRVGGKFAKKIEVANLKGNTKNRFPKN